MHALLIPSWFDTAEKPWRGTFFRDQARALQRQGLRVGIACVERRSCSGLRFSSFRNNHFQTEIEDDGGISIARMKAWSIFVQTTAGARLWCALMKRVVDRYIRLHGVPDVIHAHAALWGGYAAAAIARTLDRPFVITEHSSAIMGDRLALSRRRIVSAIYRDASAVIAVSDALRRRMRELTDGNRTMLVPNTVDTTFFTPPRRIRSRSPFRFLAVCDLVAGKRVDLLIHAFAALRRRNVEATLTIVGAGPERLRDVQRGPDRGAVDRAAGHRHPLRRSGGDREAVLRLSRRAGRRGGHDLGHALRDAPPFRHGRAPRPRRLSLRLPPRRR